MDHILARFNQAKNIVQQTLNLEKQFKSITA